MKQGLHLELLAFLTWVRDEFYRGGQQDAAKRADEMLAMLQQELASAPGRAISTARLLLYVEMILRILELWRNW